ncbi:hypothetical protein [Paenibacillus sp. USDA918EY]|nr:hypothetical protein [Paenibacillus sp. USDA918EY]
MSIPAMQQLAQDLPWQRHRRTANPDVFKREDASPKGAIVYWNTLMGRY